MVGAAKEDPSTIVRTLDYHELDQMSPAPLSGSMHTHSHNSPFPQHQRARRRASSTENRSPNVPTVPPLQHQRSGQQGAAPPRAKPSTTHDFGHGSCGAGGSAGAATSMSSLPAGRRASNGLSPRSPAGRRATQPGFVNHQGLQDWRRAASTGGAGSCTGTASRGISSSGHSHKGDSSPDSPAAGGFGSPCMASSAGECEGAGPDAGNDDVVEQFLASLFPERPTRRSQSPPLSCTAYNGDSGGGGPPTWWPSPAGRDEKVSDNGLPHLRAVQPAAAATAPPQLDVQECEWSDAADGGSSYVASTHFKAQLAGSVAPVLAASGDSDDLGGDMGDAADVPASLAGGASASGMAAGVLQDSGSLEELRRACEQLVRDECDRLLQQIGGIFQAAGHLRGVAGSSAPVGVSSSAPVGIGSNAAGGGGASPAVEAGGRPWATAAEQSKHVAGRLAGELPARPFASRPTNKHAYDYGAADCVQDAGEGGAPASWPPASRTTSWLADGGAALNSSCSGSGQRLSAAGDGVRRGGRWQQGDGWDGPRGTMAELQGGSASRLDELMERMRVLGARLRSGPRPSPLLATNGALPTPRAAEAQPARTQAHAQPWQQPYPAHPLASSATGRRSSAACLSPRTGARGAVPAVRPASPYATLLRTGAGSAAASRTLLHRRSPHTTSTRAVAAAGDCHGPWLNAAPAATGAAASSSLGRSAAPAAALVSPHAAASHLRVWPPLLQPRPAVSAPAGAVATSAALPVSPLPPLAVQRAPLSASAASFYGAPTRVSAGGKAAAFKGGGESPQLRSGSNLYRNRFH